MEDITITVGVEVIAMEEINMINGSRRGEDMEEEEEEEEEIIIIRVHFKTPDGYGLKRWIQINDSDFVDIDHLRGIVL